ncbi:MAG: aminotransferase class I/II-fold pyridoxal phosphate-dependent enzyme [Bacteroidales bacterium]|nr:aminotransferase class I/II-fold pyridoxal phosphate-dependent enzyme [Bacteroides sp.]MCM1198762.1 aminotransferase class I/II-fold pyridoxal phosphate-dependent enzyme [Clostridium sp.]MCM1502734.1 aminotransferase class I/II-fold pyridoxal phosphate-dependent enzyme [Bacteroidales bacterium]
MDIFDRIARDSGGPIGQYFEQAFGYYMYPRLEGELGPHMIFNGKPVLNWSLNNYLGLANHPEVRKADAQGAADWGLAYPMGARMMSGHTRYHEKLEKIFAEFEKKEDAFLYNFGYQGIVSTIDALTTRHDVIVYDAECHACLLDGIRLHVGSKYKYRHNDIADCDKVLGRACEEAAKNGGGVLLITEGVYGMTGALGKLDEICALKKKHNFRIMIDDAHGFGLLGEHGRGTSEHFNVMDEIDLYIGAFAKSMASIGGFVAGPKKIINYLRANMRSQMYAKSLPMPLVIGNIKRMEIIDSPEGDELRAKCWKITHAIQKGFTDLGLNIGEAEACVTPVHIPGTPAQATKMAKDLRENYGVFCSIVVYPVIPKGMVIFRIVSTAVHTMEDVEYTLKAFADIKKKLDAGEYDGDEIAAMTIE